MNYIKFFSRCGSQSFVKKRRISRYTIDRLNKQFFCTSTSIKLNPSLEEEEFLKKIIYNEVLQNNPIKRVEKPDSICLKYILPENTQVKEEKNEDLEPEKEILHFPYIVKENDESNVTETFIKTIKNFTPSDDEKIKVPQWKSENYQASFHKIENPMRWALEDLKKEQKDIEFEDIFKFGSYDPNASVSSVPCGGCGALLHCTDPKMPGFIPSELFATIKEKDLLGEKCQRCHFLKKFNVALGVNVSPSEYEKIISSIRDKSALVMIMIDILDFPCSIFPRIFNLIGPEKPVLLLVNKVDLLIQESPDFDKNFKNSILSSLKKQNISIKNIKCIELISAKTGYGIERLIDLLFENWGDKGDIYLVGCTNVGKSSLFNALIQSDLCQIRAINLLQRATISPWPGTTLNLLKFPIMKPKEWRLVCRAKRLNFELREERAFKKFQSLEQKISLEQIPLQENVNITLLENEDPDDFSKSDDSDKKPKGIHPSNLHFAKSYWVYDTPGVVHHDQIVNFLTAPELLLTVPRRMLLPRNFRLKPGHTLFIAGLARLDFIGGADFGWFTVFASMELPLTVTKTEDADEVYQKLLGTPYFRVPVHGKERLAKWPGLSPKKLRINSRTPKSTNVYMLKKTALCRPADVDIVLSSAGWVAVSLPLGSAGIMEAWTPDGKGIHLRDYPLIKRGNLFKGDAIPGTPAFQNAVKEVEKRPFFDGPSD